MGADTIIAFAPQTHYFADAAEGVAQARPPPDLTDIRPLICAPRKAGQSVHIVVSRSECANPPSSYFWDDHRHLRGVVESADVAVHVVASDVHAVAMPLAASGALDIMLRRWLRPTIKDRARSAAIAARERIRGINLSFR